MKKKIIFERDISYKVLDVKEIFSKYFFYVQVTITFENYKKIKKFVFCINCQCLSSVEIEKEIEKRIKKKLRLI